MALQGARVPPARFPLALALPAQTRLCRGSLKGRLGACTSCCQCGGPSGRPADGKQQSLAEELPHRHSPGSGSAPVNPSATPQVVITFTLSKSLEWVQLNF